MTSEHRETQCDEKNLKTLIIVLLLWTKNLKVGIVKLLVSTFKIQILFKVKMTFSAQCLTPTRKMAKIPYI